jgi:2-oxoglutarate ferredoxin oxidoreductase subunit alpha
MVVWDVQRVGPSTGMPTHTSQGDLSFSYFISHGDKDFVILLPGNMNECFEFGWQALDIAEKLQTPVIILSDLELGMNIWMADPLQYPDEIDHESFFGKMILRFAKKTNRIEEICSFDRRDTLPNHSRNLNPNAPYFTRGTSHDPYAGYSESSQDWEKNLIRIKKKFETAKLINPQPEVIDNNNELAIISYGSSDMPAKESLALLGKESIKLDYLRIRAAIF